MPIEPPDPHDITPTLARALAALRAAVARDPDDARTLIALGHVAAALAILDAPTALPSLAPPVA